MEETLESKVADTLLQKTREVKIGNKTYKAAPPSTATLILVSEAVSYLPKRRLSIKDIAAESLSVAKDCKYLGDIAAILILGARNITATIRTQRTERKPCFWGLFSREVTYMTDTVIDQKEKLSKEILETLSPHELNELITQLLSGMELGDFFALTTFLTEINLLRQTKVDK